MDGIIKMPRESDLWRLVKAGFKTVPYHSRLIRIESTVGAGLPDIIYCIDKSVTGWIELKYLPSWPKRSSTIIKLRHFTPVQRLFFKKAADWGDRVHMLLRIEDDIMLLTAQEALYNINFLTKYELTANMTARGRHWKIRKINWPELCTKLIGG